MSRPQKRSVTLAGHRTSITLESEFWQALKEIAERRGKSINQIIAEIDRARMASASEVDAGLSSAIRVFILEDLKRQAQSGH